MISLVRRDDAPDINTLSEFVIDSPADVPDLPTAIKKMNARIKMCPPGSTAYTPDLEHIYVLGNDNIWHEV